MGLEQRRTVVSNLRARLPEVVDIVLDTIAETVPAYQGLDAGRLREIRDFIAWVTVRVLDVWSEDSPLTDRDRDRLRAIGAAHAESGRSNAAILRAYRIAALTVTNLVWDDRDATHLDRTDLRAHTDVVLTAIDELSEAVLAGHSAALDRLTSDRHRALRNLFDDLLAGRHSSPAVLAGRCRELGVALPADPVLLVTEPTIGAPPAQLGIVDLLRDLGLPAAPVEHLATVREHRVVLLLPTHVRPALNAAVEARRWRGCLIGEHADTHTALAYRLATDALDSAPAHAFRARLVLDDGDAHAVQLLTTHPATDPDTVARTVLGPLAAPAQRHLLEGLAAYLAATSANAAAEHLHLHPQTLRYRLRRAVELTGRDPRDPWQRLTLDIACAVAAPFRGDPCPDGGQGSRSVRSK